MLLLLRWKKRKIPPSLWSFLLFSVLIIHISHLTYISSGSGGSRLHFGKPTPTTHTHYKHTYSYRHKSTRRHLHTHMHTWSSHVHMWTNEMWKHNIAASFILLDNFHVTSWILLRAICVMIRNELANCRLLVWSKLRWNMYSVERVDVLHW